MKPIDLSTIQYNLSLSPTKRLEQHQASLDVVKELNKAHEKLYAKPKSTLKSKCLKEYNPKLRMNPNFKPSFMDEPKSTEGLNAIYLETDLGILDVLKSVVAIGDFESIKKGADSIEVFGLPCRVVSLDQLIQIKEALGRDKDKIVLQELYAIRERINK